MQLYTMGYIYQKHLHTAKIDKENCSTHH